MNNIFKVNPQVKQERVNAVKWDNMFFDWITGVSKQFPPLSKLVVNQRVEIPEHNCKRSDSDGCEGCPIQVDETYQNE